MRLLALVLLTALLFSASANAADSIAPGMSLGAIVEALESHGYDVDSKYQLQIVPDDEDIALEFCRIDEELTLVLAYSVSSKKVTSLSIYATPENRTSRQQNVVREVAKMEFEDDGFYTLKLRRVARSSKSAK